MKGQAESKRRGSLSWKELRSGEAERFIRVGVV